MTTEEADKMQEWAGMDGAIAWHLIDRNADNWNEAGEMMNAWLRANGGGHRVPSEDKIAELEAKLQQMNSLCEFNERTMSDVASKYEALEAQNAALLVAIEAKDAALNLWKVASGNAEESELDDMACYCITMPLFCDAYDATEALALSPSTELLEARDRVRDAKLLRAVDRYLLDIGDSCSDDPLNELAKARESGEWQPELGG